MHLAQPSTELRQRAAASEVWLVKAGEFDFPCLAVVPPNRGGWTAGEPSLTADLLQCMPHIEDCGPNSGITSQELSA